jgi:hypothetical protein
METLLNFVWVLLAVAGVRLWLCHAPCKGSSRRTQIAALAMLIVILFPVISVTDDLLTIQNPAELECCARRNHSASCPHFISPIVATLPPFVVAESSFGFLRLAASSSFPVPTVDNPALASIQNRPPPAA